MSRLFRVPPNYAAILPPTQPRTERHIRRRIWTNTCVLLVFCCITVYWLQPSVRYDSSIADVEETQNKALRNPAYLIRAENGVAATENALCSEAAIGILKDGGNAVDAAVTATLCTGVVNMFSSGIGGGGFMTVRIPPSLARSRGSHVYTIDFRETAPTLANSSMYVSNPQGSKYGGLSVGVPGEIRGLEEAHRRWGSLPWSRLVQPSVDFAAEFQVGRELERKLQMYSDLVFSKPDWKVMFAPHGKLLEEGDSVRRTNLSRTLAIIASDGPGAFYKGPIADSLVQTIQDTGGVLTHADMQNYTVKVTKALEGTYRDRRVYTTHPPSSGSVLLYMMNIVENFDLAVGRTGLNVHRLLETMKFGFAARTKICDPRFTNDTARIEAIPTKEYASRTLPNITDRTHPPEYYRPEYDAKPDHGTSHTSIVDKNGMAVSVTSTINLFFGSQVMDSETGIILNDEMDDFSTPGTPNAFGLWPSPYNYPEPGKRPLSSMSPTIIEHTDGSLIAIGASGGSKIFGAVFQVLLNLLEWGSDVSQAIEYGRLHDQLYPMLVEVDDIYPTELVEDLRRRGHNVTLADVDRMAAVVQAVVREANGTLFAASDSRKNGIAAGY